MADLKQNTSPQPPRAIGPGGPGGHRSNMHARIMREKPKNIRGTLSKLMKYIGRSKFLILLLSYYKIHCAFYVFLHPQH